MPPIEIMSTLGVFGPLGTTIAPAFEAATGHTLSIRFDPTGILIAAIASGQRADVVIAIDTALAPLAQQGILDPATLTNLARSSVGLAILPNAPPLDISTPDLFVDALRSARSIAWSRAGASGLMFAKLIERLGIAEQIRAKSVIIPHGLTAERLLTGEADLAIQQLSELKAVPGIQIAGPIPAPYQETITFTAALFTNPPNPAPAQSFLQTLTTQHATAAFTQAGLEPPTIK